VSEASIPIAVAANNAHQSVVLFYGRRRHSGAKRSDIPDSKLTSICINSSMSALLLVEVACITNSRPFHMGASA
jgi:hypothetical protein